MLSQKTIAAEFARRVKQFHPREKPMEIELWGLFSWESISGHIKAGCIIPNQGYTKENKMIWCKPSRKFYNEKIAPLMKLELDKLSKMAGW